MAVKSGVKGRGSDPCAYCGEPMALARNIFGVLRATAYETECDGETWRPYHAICWRQARQPARRAARGPRVGLAEGVDVMRRAGPANCRWAAIRRTVPS